MQKTDIDTVTNVILNNEYKLHEEQENKQINEENFKIDSKNKHNDCEQYNKILIPFIKSCKQSSKYVTGNYN